MVNIPFLAFLGHVWAILDHLGSFLGHFGSFWVILGPFWAILGHIWVTLGHLGSFLAICGPFCGIFGQICGKFKFFCRIVGVRILAFRMYGQNIECQVMIYICSRLSAGILVIGGSSSSGYRSVEFWSPFDPENRSCQLKDYPRYLYDLKKRNPGTCTMDPLEN